VRNLSGQNVSTKPYQLKAWKDKRSQLLKDKCEICGGTKVLIIHHLKRSLSYHELRYLITWDFYQQLLKGVNGIPLPMRKYKHCPNCIARSGSWNVRTTKTPTYRCQKCKAEFDNGVEEEELDKAATFQLSRSIFKNDIHNLAVKMASEQFDDYMKMTNTMTICKSCHFKIHKGWIKIWIVDGTKQRWYDFYRSLFGFTQDVWSIGK
jgi:ribosomal protein L37AE/L43A